MADEEKTLEEKVQQTAKGEIPALEVIKVLFNETFLNKVEKMGFYSKPGGTSKAVIYDGAFMKEVDLPVSPTQIRSRIIIMAGLDLSRHLEPQTGKMEIGFQKYFPERETEEKRVGVYTTQTFSISDNEPGLVAVISLDSLTVYERTIPKEKYDQCVALNKSIGEKIMGAFRDLEEGRTPLDWLDQNNKVNWDKLLPPEDASFIRDYIAMPYIVREVRRPEED